MNMVVSQKGRPSGSILRHGDYKGIMWAGGHSRDSTGKISIHTRIASLMLINSKLRMFLSSALKRGAD